MAEDGLPDSNLPERPFLGFFTKNVFECYNQLLTENLKIMILYFTKINSKS
jgi:hypothetical protein